MTNAMKKVHQKQQVLVNGRWEVTLLHIILLALKITVLFVVSLNSFLCRILP